MRTIKFRAWDKKTGTMYYDETPDKDSWYIDTLSALNYHLSTSYQISQFTGLFDKNGKEIWEGDIVTSLGTTFIVEYDGDGFYAVNGDEYASLNSYTGLNYPYDIDDAEVIGNLYENPEILSNTK